MKGEATTNSDPFTLRSYLLTPSSNDQKIILSHRATPHNTEMYLSGVMDGAWINIPSEQQLQQKYLVEGLSWCSHQTLALQRQSGTGYGGTEKIKEAQGLKEGKDKQVGVIGKRNYECKKEEILFWKKKKKRTGSHLGSFTPIAVPNI